MEEWLLTCIKDCVLGDCFLVPEFGHTLSHSFTKSFDANTLLREPLDPR
jgi:hypothetical protein